jgi:hypothetical protein
VKVREQRQFDLMIFIVEKSDSHRLAELKKDVKWKAISMKFVYFLLFIRFQKLNNFGALHSPCVSSRIMCVIPGGSQACVCVYEL